MPIYFPSYDEKYATAIIPITKDIQTIIIRIMVKVISLFFSFFKLHLDFIINSIIFGTLRETNIIREVFDNIAQELHIKSEQLIKELKLDKK